MFDLPQKLSGSAEKILQQKFGVSAPVFFDISTDEGRGDLSTSVALQLAKKLGKKPQDIAKELVEGLSTVHGVAAAEVAGPGYVNIILTVADLAAGLTTVQQSTIQAPTRKKDPPVIVEYCSLNIAKPLGVHHILVTMIGHALANLYAHCGYPTIRWNYLGDWGTQFGKLTVAYKKWGKGKDPSSLTIDDLLKLYVQFHDEAQHDASLEEEGQAMFHKLEKGDKEVRSIWQAFVDVTKREVAPTLKRLDVHFDTDKGESQYEGAMQAIIDEGKKKGVFVTGEKGALIVQFPEESKLPPAVVLKSDGATNYLTRDLALVRDRVDTYHPNEILHVVGVEQSLHFQQLMATARLLQWKLPTWEHVSFGRMQFADKGMSTRKGNVLKLEDVLDEAVSRADKIIKDRGTAIQTDNPAELADMMGTGALVYGVLSQNRKMNIIFDWDKMLSFEGNSAPYLQYTHARAKSVLRKGNVEGFVMPKSLPDVLSAKERVLVKLLLNFGSTIESARAERAPHRLCTYLYELCQAYNSFYNADEILTAPEKERLFRLSLTSVTASVLKTGANLLSLRVPERM